jgi:DNA invertase Pin-like site-specific DNA recombinase
MLEDAKRGKFGVLVIWAIDTFGRSMAANLGDILALDRVGVT